MRRRRAGARRGPASAESARASSSTLGGGGDSRPSMSGAEVLHVGDRRRSTAPAPSRGSCTTAAGCRAPRRSRPGARPGPSVEASSAAASGRRWSGSPVRGAVPASGWERTTSPWRATSSSGRGADEAVDRVAVARLPNEARSRSRTACTSSGAVGGRPRTSRAITTFVSRPAADCVAAGRDGGEVASRRRRRARTREAARRGDRRRAAEVGVPRSASAPSIVVIHAVPSGVLADHDRGDDQLGPARRAGTAAPRAPPARSRAARPRRRARSRPARSGDVGRAARGAATPRPARPTPSRTNRKPSPRATPLRSTSRPSGRVTALTRSCPRRRDELGDAARQQAPLRPSRSPADAQPGQHLGRAAGR